jgi:sirohydrochlorin cobaltochelatase
MARLILMAGDSLGHDVLEGVAWDWCSSFATALGEPVLFATIGEDRLPVEEFVFPPNMVTHGEIMRPVLDGPAKSMSSAPFLYREDGRPDWGAMWSGFCELALFGGPPHRGEDSALRASDAPLEESMVDAIDEIKRGIYETTGLLSSTAEAGWLAVHCDSTKMAAWLSAVIILENVDARCEGETLLVPARADYALKDQVKSIITVVAKANHYWKAHVAQVQPDVCGIDGSLARTSWPVPGPRTVHPPHPAGVR